MTRYAVLLRGVNVGGHGKLAMADFRAAIEAAGFTDVATYLNGAEVESHLPLFNNGVVLGQQVFSVSSPTRIYADPNSVVTIALLGPSTGSAGSIVGVYGHLVPVN